jgi:predicted naringenin-chalcone synthase
MAHVTINGIGTSVPTNWIAQQDAAVLAQSLQSVAGSTPRALAALYRRSGVGARHSVVLESSSNGEAARQSFYCPATSAADRGPWLSQRMKRFEQEAGTLAAEASRSALAAARIDPARVTHLITVSCTGFVAPGFDVELFCRLPLRATVARTHIGFMGCHAALNALRVARAFILAEPQAVVLICAVELCTLHQQYSNDAGQLVSNSLFADGAAAMVCSGTTRDEPQAWRLMANGATILSDTLDEMTWRLGDHGFQMALSANVPDILRAQLRGWIEPWLMEHGLSVHQVAHWAVHPGGPRVLTAVAEALRLEPTSLEASRETLHRYGNMSSPTVVFILERLRMTGAGGPCVAMGFGPGLAFEAALLV